MLIDPRQVVAAFLTLSMFCMLGNMIKKDHFDPYFEVQTSGTRSEVLMLEEHSASRVQVTKNGPWTDNGSELKPCWSRPASKEAEQSRGFITFSLTTGPEYHISQITDAVVIARFLGATLVLPDIRGSELGQKRNFQDVYDVEKFMKSLDGVVKIVRELPGEVAARKPALVRVPNRVSEDFIVKNIEPIFRTKSYLRLAITFHSINLGLKEKHNAELDSTSCLAMFGSLELNPKVREVGNTVVERLRTMSRKSGGKFVAVDLRVDDLEKKSCKESGSSGSTKTCYSAQEVAGFLKRVGFGGDTTIYVTQTWWHNSLDILKESFPRTYTKEDIVPAEKKAAFLKSGGDELQRTLDFHVCSESDVFVPAVSGLFYSHVAGKRIPAGRNQILVPSTSAADSISAYVSEKNHWVYSCFCS